MKSISVNIRKFNNKTNKSISNCNNTNTTLNNNNTPSNINSNNNSF